MPSPLKYYLYLTSPILLAVLGVATVFNVDDVNEGEPVRVPEEVLEGLEAVRRYTLTDLLDIPILRYVASETKKPALVVWVDKHPSEYGRGLLDGFEVED